MKRKSRGQTLVEFALVFPLIMVFLFSTIDIGYWIYAWSQVQFAARRGAEQASILQPREVRANGDYSDFFGNDPCFDAIVTAARRSGAFNVNTTVQADDIFVTFYDRATSATPLAAANANQLGNIVEVRVQQSLDPLTPIGQTLRRNQPYLFNALSRRTIMANGPTFNVGTSSPDFRTCTY